LGIPRRSKSAKVVLIPSCLPFFERSDSVVVTLCRDSCAFNFEHSLGKQAPAPRGVFCARRGLYGVTLLGVQGREHTVGFLTPKAIIFHSLRSRSFLGLSHRLGCPVGGPTLASLQVVGEVLPEAPEGWRRARPSGRSRGYIRGREGVRVWSRPFAAVRGSLQLMITRRGSISRGYPHVHNAVPNAWDVVERKW
jgi:hypothetical protein